MTQNIKHRDNVPQQKCPAGVPYSEVSVETSTSERHAHKVVSTDGNDIKRNVHACARMLHAHR